MSKYRRKKKDLRWNLETRSWTMFGPINCSCLVIFGRDAFRYCSHPFPDYYSEVNNWFICIFTLIKTCNYYLRFCSILYWFVPKYESCTIYKNISSEIGKQHKSSTNMQITLYFQRYVFFYYLFVYTRICSEGKCLTIELFNDFYRPDKAKDLSGKVETNFNMYKYG